MSRLCDQLRQIYASGDSMTVLKLLKELIDAVEDFEGTTATSEQVEYLTNKVAELTAKIDAPKYPLTNIGDAFTDSQYPIPEKETIYTSPSEYMKVLNHLKHYIEKGYLELENNCVLTLLYYYIEDNDINVTFGTIGTRVVGGILIDIGMTESNLRYQIERRDI